MGEAAKILKMIESVDPSDTYTLDEIDARAECFCLGWRFVRYDKDNEFPVVFIASNADSSRMQYKQYTRSRDALKSIRPEGWFFGFVQFATGFQYIIEHEADGLVLRTRELPTEELAELHAIIQAIEWSRNNDQTHTD